MSPNGDILRFHIHKFISTSLLDPQDAHIKKAATILGLYLAGLLFYFLEIWLFNSHDDAIDFYQSPVFWLFPLVFIALGFAVGGLLYILNHPRNFRFLFYGTLVGLLVFCITDAGIGIYNWYFARYLARQEANESFLNSSSTYPAQEHQAFKLLTDRYPSPNDLALFSMSNSRYDSTVGGRSTEIYDFTFEYHRIGQAGVFTSRCLIIGGRGELEYFDRALSKAELHRRDSLNEGSLREGLRSILNDSVKLSLDSVTKAAMRKKLDSLRL